MAKMKKNNIYIPLQGRIGNQLFQYAVARSIQIEKGTNTTIVFDDYDVLRCGWENSLVHYNLPNVEYIHDSIAKNRFVFSFQSLLRNIYKITVKRMNYTQKYNFEKKIQAFINKRGVLLCENGYIKNELNLKVPNYLEGYFQSNKYFSSHDKEIKELIANNFADDVNRYPNINLIRNRNTVCISVKVEHNVGSSIYSVCGIEYWKRAIEYIIENVENPLFFVCSDNVPFVLENLIDTTKFDYVLQDKDMPVHVSLAAMSESKHFVIGNTTFGWWAQYLSKNKSKIVVAPSRWMAIDMPIDIYQSGWHLVEV